MAKALIVSSDEGARYLYQMAIAFQKVEVLAARSIREAVAKIARSIPDLVVMDLETINLDELPLLKGLSKKQRELPVIILTEMKPAEAKRQACMLGTCQILAKTDETLGRLIKKTRQTVGK